MTARAILRTALVSTFLLTGACSGDAEAPAVNDNVLNVYNWADYKAPDTIERFEKEFGIKVHYDTYDSSEVLDVKLLAGNSGYDIVIHSNQFASRLAPIGVFEKLDMARFENLGNLDAKVLARVDVYHKVTDYNLPYHWGTTGYAWNADMVRERLPDHPMDSGDVLFDPDVVSKLADCGVSLLDGPGRPAPSVSGR